MNQQSIRSESCLTQDKSDTQKGIKGRIKSYMDSVSIDLFGIERMVNKNVQRFAMEIAQSRGTTPQRVAVQINLTNDILKAILIADGKPIKELTIKEMVQFFTGQSSSKMISSVNDSIIRFMQEYAKREVNQVPDLHILIISSPKGAIVKSFDQLKFIEYIPVKSLIKYFK